MDIPNLSEKQVNFINERAHLSFRVSVDLSSLTDDQICDLEDAVCKVLCREGFTPDQNDVNEIGAMAESILDYIGEYY